MENLEPIRLAVVAQQNRARHRKLIEGHKPQNLQKRPGKFKSYAASDDGGWFVWTRCASIVTAEKWALDIPSGCQGLVNIAGMALGGSREIIPGCKYPLNAAQMALPLSELIALFPAPKTEDVMTNPTPMPVPQHCETHKIAMVTEQEHIGDGKTQWSEPYCPYCREIAAAKAVSAPASQSAAAPQKPATAPTAPAAKL